VTCCSPPGGSGRTARGHALMLAPFFYETLLDTCGVSTCAGLVYAGERKLVKIYCMPTRSRERMMTCRASRSLLGRIWTRPDPTYYYQHLNRWTNANQASKSPHRSMALPYYPCAHLIGVITTTTTQRLLLRASCVE
jgi:hypothetical protein